MKQESDITPKGSKWKYYMKKNNSENDRWNKE